MKKYKLIVLVFITGMLLGCKNESGTSGELKEGNADQPMFVLKGKVANPESAVGQVYLNQLIGQNIIRKDTATVNASGEFEFKGHVEIPDVYQIMFKSQQAMYFILGNQELTFSADMLNFDSTSKISGSRDQDVFESLSKAVEIWKQERGVLEARNQQAAMEGNEELMKQLAAEFEAVQEKNRILIKKIIADGSDSFVAGMGALRFINPEQDFQFVDSISSILNKNFPNSRYTMELYTRVNSMRVVSPGAMAPEISLPGPDGVVNSLSNYRGKYVLIDFWASWCGPCRRENPNVVRMYEKFKGDKFEIFGVSLDKSGEKWQEAIRKDRITWPQVSDLQWWESSAAASYQVKSIPATFLIDPEGRIIGKNLRGQQLEEKLQEILG